MYNLLSIASGSPWKTCKIAETIAVHPSCNEAGMDDGSSSRRAHRVTMLNFLSCTRGRPDGSLREANHLSKKVRAAPGLVCSIIWRAAAGL